MHLTRGWSKTRFSSLQFLAECPSSIQRQYVSFLEVKKDWKGAQRRTATISAFSNATIFHEAGIFKSRHILLGAARPPLRGGLALRTSGESELDQVLAVYFSLKIDPGVKLGFISLLIIRVSKE